MHALPPQKILTELFLNYSDLAIIKEDILRVFQLTENSLKSGGTVFVCGNGGSAADSEHIVGELVKGFLSERQLTVSEKQSLINIAGAEIGGLLGEKLQKGLKAVSLCSAISLNTAVINDQGGDFIFAQQLLALGRQEDILWALSTSGNAKNVLHAVAVARMLGMKTAGFTGASGGSLAGCADICVKVPAVETFRIQEFHLPVYHALCAMLESAFFL